MVQRNRTSQSGGRPRRWRRRRADHEPRRGWVPVLAIIASLALLDWAIKTWVAASVPLGGFVEVWPGRLALWHVQNPAMVLGLWGELAPVQRQLLALAASSLALLLLYEIVERCHRLPRRQRPWAWVFVGMAFGGMLGNLGERLLYWSVTDYLSLAWGDVWLPPGNVADLALFLSFPLAVPVIRFELAARARRGTARPPDPSVRLSRAGATPTG